MSHASDTPLTPAEFMLTRDSSNPDIQRWRHRCPCHL